MSENHKKESDKALEVSSKDPVSDFTPKDLKAIEKYQEEGLPGISILDESRLKQMMEMYLSGKTYSQIASATRQTKAMVMYLSKKFSWYSEKMEYLTEIEESIGTKLVENKIESQHFLLNLAQNWQHTMGKKMKKYVESGDEKFINEIDLKVIDKYLKVLETIHKTHSAGVNEGKSPAVGINVGSGMTVKKINDNEVEITPKEKKLGDMLKKMADERREETKRALKQSEDSEEK